MTLRNAAIALIASSLLALPAAATASPLPDPPSRRTADTVQLAIDQLTEAYAHATTSEKRRIHNEIVLLVNVGPAAL